MSAARRTSWALAATLFAATTLLLTTMLLAVAPARVSAQSPSELGAARDLFQEGLAASRAGRWDEARAAFERSLAIVERPSTLLNLAGAQVETGHFVAAAASYRRFLEIATGREARLRGGAETALAEVEARIAHVTLEAPGAQPGDRVELDGSATALGESVALDPGAHEVVVLRGDDEVARRSFAVAEGETTSVRLVVRSAVGTPQDLGTPEEPAPVAAPETGGEDLTWVWVGVGIGVAVAAGVAIGVGVAVGTSEPTYYGGNLGDGMIRF